MAHKLKMQQNIKDELFKENERVRIEIEKSQRYLEDKEREERCIVESNHTLAAHADVLKRQN